MIRYSLTLAVLCSLTLAARASDVPTDPAARAKIVGQPKSLLVQPDKLHLEGPRATAQPVVTGIYADGTVRDLTHLAEFKVDGPGVFAVDAERFITAKGNGASTLTITAGGQTVKLPITVRSMEKPQPVSFRNEVIASLNVGGCNSGACHGTPTGKNGFKLSLRGYDPASDFVQLTRDVYGRRTDRLNPESSLVMQKSLGRVSHEGSVRFPHSSIACQTIMTWMSEGLTDDPTTLPSVKKVDVLPGQRILNAPSRFQQLSVIAHFTDGTSKDVTRLTVFSSSDPAIANVNATGLVEFGQSGEVAILCRFLMELVPVRLMYLEPKANFAWSNPPEVNYVDKHTFSKLKMLNILPSDLCSDQEFIRRAYLDVCGILPAPGDVAEFLGSKDPTKRAKLIDQLLERPEYADFWTLKWSDVFRSTRKTIQLKGTHVFQKWMHNHIDKNTGFDQVVYEVITSGGSTFANPAANYYRVSRDPTTLAETTAQLFFGIRMQCAKCHNHPFERWTQDDYYSMAAFFNRVKYRVDPIDGGDPKVKNGAEYVYVERFGELNNPRTGKAMAPKFMGGAIPDIAPGKDRREALGKWMASGDNPFVPKSIVNRIWFHLMGRGIVDPVDDFRDSNPSANDELLDALAKDFVKNKWDVKQLLRTVMNSRTYQLSAQTNDFNREDNKYFSHAVTKLLTAEQLFDALCQVTEVPEKFAGYPLGTRSVQMPDGETNHPFLKTFNQPARELACECEREGDSNLAQALQLINGPAVNGRLSNPANRIGKLLAAKKSDKDIVNELFLVTLSRNPNATEETAMLRHVSASLLGVHVLATKARPDLHIEQITPDSPAAKAGLKLGDVIKKIDGAAITTADQYYAAMAGKMPGAAMTVTVVRDGKDVDLKTTLAADKRKAWEDVHWALINSKEFLFRH
ncbi:MAG: DUF1553 domain-containing protein [Planctomycetes bacterium]|nr:DUF1553 domain-containing protein [Planctomycetota bacterium]